MVDGRELTAGASAEFHHGPAADMLRERLAAASVDMVYMDPPFGNGQVWTGEAGSFDDRWLDQASSEGWNALDAHNPVGAELLKLVAAGRGKHAPGYLGAMAAILIEARRTLKPTGSLWLHHDDTFSSELRILGDTVFGPANAIGTVIWHRATAKATTRAFARNHDTVAVWGRSRAARWRLWRTRSGLVHGDPAGGSLFVGGVANERLNAKAKERVGYPTQKPTALISRFVAAATLPGDLVLDPTCGSGTTLVAALALGRRAVGIDLSADAIAAARARLPIASLRTAPVAAPLAVRPIRQLDLFSEAA